MDATEIPTAIHGNPVEWIYEVDPPRYPSGYPGDGPLEKTRVLLLSVANSGTESQRYWVTCLGVTGKIMAGDSYFTLEQAKSFPSQEFGLPNCGWTRPPLDVNEINDPILDWVEQRGGGYVWEPEVFAVIVLEAAFDDEDAERLSRLVGVQQIAVDASRMSLEGLKKLATIPGISSLVIRTDNLTSGDVESLRATCPDVQIIE